jgi:hypothetical protein
MVVTLPCDVRYGNAFQLSAYFAFIARCNMRMDGRDVSEIVKFDLFEETVGSWLRSVIKRLEEERTAISTGSLADRSSRNRHAVRMGTVDRRGSSVDDETKVSSVLFRPSLGFHN